MRNVNPPLSRVLVLLRLFRDSGNLAHTISHAQSKSLKVGEKSATFFRFVATTLELIDEAERAVKEERRIGDEGRAGLLASLTKLRAALVPPGLNQKIQDHFPDMNTTISHFSLIAELLQPPGALTEEADDELTALLDDLDVLYKKVHGATIDDGAKTAVLANIDALQILLKNTDLFGFDAAKSAYVELLSTIQREVKKADEKTADFLSGTWTEVEKMAGRVTLINGAVYAGIGLIEAATPVLRVITGG